MKFVFLLILTFLPLLGFAQEGSESGPSEDDVVDSAIGELEAKRVDRQKKMEMLTEVVGPEKKDDEQFSPTDLFNNQALNRMELTLREAKMSQFPPELVRQKMLEAFKGHPLEGYIQTSPKLQDFFVDFIRDDKALISAIHIFKDKPRLKIYFYFWVAIMFFAWWTKKLFISKFWSKGTQIFARILFSLTISTMTLSAFCLVFEAEMRPIISIIKKHL